MQQQNQNITSIELINNVLQTNKLFRDGSYDKIQSKIYTRPYNMKQRYTTDYLKQYDLYPLFELNENLIELDDTSPVVLINNNIDNSSRIKSNNIVDFINKFNTRVECLNMNYVNLDNLLIAGGCVKSILLNQPINDVDIFIYGIESSMSAEKRIEKCIRDIFEYYRQYNKTHIIKNVFITSNDYTITLYIDDLKIQFITRLYKSISEILHSFDLGSSAVGFDGSQVYFTTLSKFAYEYFCNILDLTDKNNNYETRLIKYFNSGFNIILPNFNMETITNNVNKSPSFSYKNNKIRSRLLRLKQRANLLKRQANFLDSDSSSDSDTEDDIEFINIEDVADNVTNDDSKNDSKNDTNACIKVNNNKVNNNAVNDYSDNESDSESDSDSDSETDLESIEYRVALHSMIIYYNYINKHKIFVEELCHNPNIVTVNNSSIRSYTPKLTYYEDINFDKIFNKPLSEIDNLEEILFPNYFNKIELLIDNKILDTIRNNSIIYHNLRNLKNNKLFIIQIYKIYEMNYVDFKIHDFLNCTNSPIIKILKLTIKFLLDLIFIERRKHNLIHKIQIQFFAHDFINFNRSMMYKKNNERNICGYYIDKLKMKEDMLYNMLDLYTHMINWKKTFNDNESIQMSIEKWYGKYYKK